MIQYNDYIKIIVEASHANRDYMVMLARTYASIMRNASPVEIQNNVALFEDKQP